MSGRRKYKVENKKGEAKKENQSEKKHKEMQFFLNPWVKRVFLIPKLHSKLSSLEYTLLKTRDRSPAME